MVIKSIINWGTKNQPTFLAEKIRLSNITGLIFSFGVALPFTIISYNVAPPLMNITVSGLFLSFLGIFLANFYPTISRLIVALSPGTLCSFYHAGAISIDAPVIYGVSMANIGFLLAPFLLFDIKIERFYIFITGIYSCALLVFFKPLNKLIELDNIEEHLFHEGWLFYASIFAAIIMAYGQVITLSIIAKRSTLKSESLLINIKENEKTLASKQEELELSGKSLQLKISEIEQQQKEDEKKYNISNQTTELNTYINETSDEIEVMVKKVLFETIRFIGANQGVLYLLEEEEEEKPYMKQVATYAYDREKHLNVKRIHIGEGFIGQCWFEKEQIRLSKIPEDYIDITSGLGEALPREILIYPLMNNKEVIGIIELATFTPIHELYEDYLLKISENLSAKIIGIRNVTKTAKLLEASQRMENELRSREEELHQNAEELMATQEEMNRTIQELQEKLAEYEKN